MEAKLFFKTSKSLTKRYNLIRLAKDVFKQPSLPFLQYIGLIFRIKTNYMDKKLRMSVLSIGLRRQVIKLKILNNEGRQHSVAN